MENAFRKVARQTSPSVKIQFGTYEGHKKADFLITDTSYSLRGLAFVNGNQLYILSTISKSPTESKDEFDYFVKSFTLTSEKPL